MGRIVNIRGESEPEDLAALAVFLASPVARYITGTVTPWMEGCGSISFRSGTPESDQLANAAPDRSALGIDNVSSPGNGLCSQNILHGGLGLLSEPIHEQFDATIADQIGWPLGNLDFRALNRWVVGECGHEASRRNRICDQK